MKIDQKKVEFIARLAGLELEEEEKKEYEKELSSILDFVEQLSQVKTRSSKSSSSQDLEELFNVFDEDKIEIFEEREKIIRLFPNQENNFLKIKAVFKNK